MGLARRARPCTRVVHLLFDPAKQLRQKLTFVFVATSAVGALHLHGLPGSTLPSPTLPSTQVPTPELPSSPHRLLSLGARRVRPAIEVALAQNTRTRPPKALPCSGEVSDPTRYLHPRRKSPGVHQGSQLGGCICRRCSLATSLR